MIGLLKYQCYLIGQDSQRLMSQSLMLMIVLILFGMVLSHNNGFMANEVLILTTYIVLTLNLSTLFQDDIQSGFMEAYIASGKSIEAWVVCKTLTVWIFNLFPLVLISWAFSYSLGKEEILIVLKVQMLTSFIIVMLGAISSVLTLSVRNSSLLLPLISLPIMVPSLLISFTILEHPGHESYFYLLGGLCCISVALSWVMTPFAIKLILK